MPHQFGLVAGLTELAFHVCDPVWQTIILMRFTVVHGEVCQPAVSRAAIYRPTCAGTTVLGQPCTSVGLSECGAGSLQKCQF